MQDQHARGKDGSRRTPRVRTLLLGCLVVALAACQAGAPPPAAGAPSAAAATRPADAGTATQAPAPMPAADAAPIGAPSPAAAPPAVVPPARQPAPQPGDAPPAASVPTAAERADALVDRCSTDADCEVKDVGSCCGYRPRCLNRDSPTFADEVRARCQAEGRLAHCGISAVAGCACEAGRCVNVTPTDNVLVQ